MMKKEIQGWPGYFIYADGRVWSEKSLKFLATQPNAKGYLRVCLSNKQIKKYVAVHRLVAEAFIINDNPAEKIEINHIDEDITNNSVENLAWIAPYDNLHYGSRADKISKANGKKIRQYNKDGELLAVYTSCASAARVTGLNRQGINNCANGKTKSSGGYVWRWEDDE